MNSDLCKKLDIEFPLFAFSYCSNVVAVVSNAGPWLVGGSCAEVITPRSKALRVDRFRYSR